MKRLTMLLIALISLISIQRSFCQVEGNNERKLAVYLTGEGIDENYRANLSSVQQIIAVSGLSSVITSNFNECMNYGMILFGNTVDEDFLSASQRISLINYVRNGGSVILPGLTDPGLYNLAGIEESRIKNNRYIFSIKTTLNDRELRWIDEQYEKEVKIGGNKYGDIFATIGYYVTDAEVLGLYENSNQAALIKNKFGDGLVYCFGVNWRDVIIRNLLDRDYQANRIYSNAFEATADVFMLLVRGMFAQAIPSAVWISPAPYDSKAVYIITHDVCSHTAHIFSNDFAQMEYERGISATYNITTHQFIDDINGDNYSSHIPQMKLLINKGHTIGSHSFGHFPDFADGDIFPKGEPITSISQYNPHFSVEEGRTIGGTAYGELGVSKMLLENDLNIDVLYHRSGHLAVNPAQYDIINELGYKYSSTYSAADLLTGFPFYVHAGRAMNGEKLPVIEIPLAISDVFGSYGSPIDEFNWEDKAKLWLDVLNSYANNNALTLILVHPNRRYKLDAMNYVFDNMPEDIYTMGFGEYAEFWKAKENIKFSHKLEGSTLKIYASDDFFENDAYSFVADDPDVIETVELYNSNNELVSINTHDYYLGTTVVYQKGLSELKGHFIPSVNQDDILYQNYPNPFSYYTKIKYQVPENAKVHLEVIDMFGRHVENIVNENKVAGMYEMDYSSKKLTNGIYFLQIHIYSEDNYYTATRKIVIQ